MVKKINGIVKELGLPAASIFNSFAEKQDILNEEKFKKLIVSHVNK
jgi:hypothetical protein